MDVVSFLSAAWDKGAWCFVAVALGIFLWKVCKWLKPHLETFFKEHVDLVKVLKATCQQQAAANETNAVANAENAKAIQQLTARPACQAATPKGAENVPLTNLQAVAG